MSNLQGRHWRAIFGVFLICVSIAMVAVTIWHPIEKPGFFEVIYHLLFPVLLFASGFALVSRDALGDVVNAAKNLLPRRSP